MMINSGLLVKLLAAALAIAALICGSNGLAVTIDAHEEQCFYEEVKTGTRMGLTFQVAEGGFLDIDVVIKGPDDKVIYNGDRETEGKYTFSAHMDGRYKYCFNNAMSTVTPKLVVFDMVVGGREATPTAQDTDAQHDKLKDMVAELTEALQNVKRENLFMTIREQTHRSINESTNSRVAWWSFFEALVLVVMSVGQVYYLHRFFEVRSTV